MTDQTQERAIMEKLELKIRPLTQELKYYFDGHTTINPNTDFVIVCLWDWDNRGNNICQWDSAPKLFKIYVFHAFG